jgi:hypothetical protein
MEVGKDSGKIEPLLLNIWRTTVLFPVFWGVKIYAKVTKKQEHKIGECGNSFLTACLIVTMTIHFIFYSQTLSAMNSDDFNMLKYAMDNECSDGPLQRSLQFYFEGLSGDKRLVIFAYAASALCLLIFFADFVIACKAILGKNPRNLT